MRDDIITSGPDKISLRGKHLRQLRGMLGITIEKFSALCEVGESTIRQWEQGRGSGLTAKGANKIIALMRQHNIECKLEWLLEGKGAPPLFRHALVQDSKGNLEKIENEIDLFRQQHQQTIICFIQDDGIEPLYFKGDYVGGIQYVGDSIKKLDGEICIVQTLDKQTLVRKIKTDAGSSNKYSLYTINPSTSVAKPIQTEMEILSAATIIRVWRVEHSQ